jgi:hypothetical protein
MADDLSQADLVQIAAATAAEGCPEEGDTQACAAGAGVIVISQPPDGEVVRVPTQEGQSYLLNFAAHLATVQLIDVDGDGKADHLALVFNQGTPEESQIVFLGLPALAGSGNPPVFLVSGVPIGSGSLVAQAEALAGQQPTLETAAGEGQGPLGGGANVYNDNLGPAPGLLTPEGPIPPRFMEFGFERQEVTDLELIEEPPPPPVARAGSVSHDETAGVQEDADDVAPPLPEDIQDIVDTVLQEFESEAEVCGQAVSTLSFSDGSISLDSVVDGTDSGLDTGTLDSPEDILLFNGGDNVVVGQTAGGDVIFMVILDPVTGDVWLIQFNNVLHSDPMNPDDAETFDLTFTVTGPGGSVTETLTVEVQDDGPNDISPEDSVLGNSDGSSDTSDLDLGGNVGKDTPGDVVFSGGEDGDALTGTIGDGPSVELTSDDHKILLMGFGTDTLMGFVDNDDSGTINVGDTKIMEITLDPNSDTYTVTMFGMIDNGEEVIFDDFSGIGGGLNVFFPLDSSSNPGSEQDLLITGTVPGVTPTSTVNTDNDDVGTGDQWLDSEIDEIIRLDYVENVSGDSTDLSTLTYDTHYTVNDAGFRVRQLQGNKAITRSVEIKVYDQDEDPQGSDFNPDGIGDPAEQDDITRVTVYDASTDTEYVFTSDDTQGAFTVTFNADGNGSVLIEGLSENDEVTVSTDDGFNQMEILNQTDGNNLGIALDQFSFGELQEGEPIDMSFDLLVTDADDDTSSGTIDVTLLPEVTGTGDDDVLSGSGDDQIFIGGGGADTFEFTLAADEGTDSIIDFSTVEGDILSFTDVVDVDAPGGIDIEDVVVSFVDGGGAGAVDTLVLESGTTILITDVDGTLTDLASLDANSLINGA